MVISMKRLQCDLYHKVDTKNLLKHYFFKKLGNEGNRGKYNLKNSIFPKLKSVFKEVTFH